MPGRRRSRLVDEPDLQGRIVALVRAGAYPERAAAAAGVSPSTHYRWQTAGLDERARIEDGNRPRKGWAVYLEYVDALDQATAQAEVALLEKVSQGGQGWQAQLAVLERRFRDRWSPKAQARRAPPSGGTGGTVTGLDALALRRARRQAGQPPG